MTNWTDAPPERRPCGRTEQDEFATELSQDSEPARAIGLGAYLLDSAHHGLSMDQSGTKLCVAGTMSDYAAIVSRQTFAYKILQVGHKPYWSTNSGDGRYCFVSVSGDDRVSAISYRTGREVARIAVGDHPQRMRMGVIRRSYLR